MTRSPQPPVETTPFIVGWEEWLALPDLELPAIRAKIDTGAKTSALHAFAIEPFGPSAAPMVRFGIHPIPGREDIARYCAAAIIDRREVTSSNGEKETRFVIRTRLVLGMRDWGEIETTLANRESMAYRMLLGRQAIRGGLLVDPAASFVQPRLSHKLYAGLPKQAVPPRRLRIALIATKPARTSNLMLQEEAHERGHALDILPLDSLVLDFDAAQPRLLAAGQLLPPYDAVVARATGGAPGLAAAVVQHLQRTGTAALNSGEAIERLRNPYLVASRLHAHGLPAPIIQGEPAAARILVILGHAIAAQGGAGPSELRFAARIAAALGLGMVAIDLAGNDGAWRVAGIDPNPPLTGYKQAATLARAIIAAVETRVRTPAPLPATADGDA
jgi:ribosomal protein S6--L-glutamate ligase